MTTPNLFDDGSTAANICSSCGLVQQTGKEHTEARHCIVALQRSAARLVSLIGTPGTCRGCQATIYFVMCRQENAGGASMKPAMKPYDANGASHFTTCPRRADFYGKRQ